MDLKGNSKQEVTELGVHIVTRTIQQSAGVNRDNICTGQLERADKMRQGE